MNTLRKIYHKIKQKIEARRYKQECDHWASIPPVKTILKVIPGLTHERQQRRLCLFSHFDIHGRVDPYVLHYLDQIKKNNFDVVLISTSPSIDPRDFSAVSARCRFYIHRTNIGLDFGSWKAAMDYLKDFSEYDELLLANDSVFGPIYDLKETFDKFQQMPQKVCGLVDTWEIYYHIQSYFVFFKTEALKSDLFGQFWNNVKLVLDKNYIIENYEIGLSQHFLRNGFELGACVEFVELRDYLVNKVGENKFQYHDRLSREPGNPTLFAWEALISDRYRFPFIKTELLKYNRLGSKNVVNWRHLMPPNSEPMIKLISNFLKRTQWNARGC